MLKSSEVNAMCNTRRVLEKHVLHKDVLYNPNVLLDLSTKNIIARCFSVFFYFLGEGFRDLISLPRDLERSRQANSTSEARSQRPGVSCRTFHAFPAAWLELKIKRTHLGMGSYNGKGDGQREGHRTQ